MPPKLSRLHLNVLGIPCAEKLFTCTRSAFCSLSFFFTLMLTAGTRLNHVPLLDGVLGGQAKARLSRICAHHCGGVCRQSAAQARTLLSHLLHSRGNMDNIVYTLFPSSS